MIETNLPSPSIGGKGHHLRRIAANAISQMEVSAPNYTGGAHPNQYLLANFFLAAADGALADGLTAPQASFAAGAATFSVATGATAGPALDAGGSAGAVTYSSSATGTATVNSATGVVTGVAPGTCFITAAVAANGIYRARTIRYKAVVTA